MSNVIERSIRQLGQTIEGQLSLPGDERYLKATGLWAKAVGPMPRAVVHCRTPRDVQAAIRSARESDLSLSVRGGGHDWAGRALCDGVVIDLTAMNQVTANQDAQSVLIGEVRVPPTRLR